LSAIVRCPDLELHLVNRNVFLQRSPGAVHEHVELSESVDRRQDRVRYAPIARGIRLDEQCGITDLALGTPAGLAVELRDRHFRALPHVCLRRRLRNARSGTGEERNLALESAQVFSPVVRVHRTRCARVQYDTVPTHV